MEDPALFKDVHIWLPQYIVRKSRLKTLQRPLSILFAFVDHFEPMQKPADPLELQVSRVSDWIEKYERLCLGHEDSLGRPPRHTYFFPQEQYDPGVLDMLARHCRSGFGEVEIHIHHDNDTPEGFVDKIGTFKKQLESHGLLPVDRRSGGTAYGFVHGNWSLDNSRKDGRWCGINNEITLLRETGCYADFTLPCSPADGQTRKVNSIYFADDDPLRPKSHDTGRDVIFGGKTTGDLLLIQGPLTLNWNKRPGGFLPGIENGDVSLTNPITRARIKLWIDTGIAVRGKENVVFIKVHTHGMKPRNTPPLLGPETSSALKLLETEFNDGRDYTLYYVSAREMANVVYAFNDGIDMPVRELLDYKIPLTKPFQVLGRKFKK